MWYCCSWSCAANIPGLSILQTWLHHPSTIIHHTAGTGIYRTVHTPITFEHTYIQTSVCGRAVVYKLALVRVSGNPWSVEWRNPTLTQYVTNLAGLFSNFYARSTLNSSAYCAPSSSPHTLFALDRPMQNTYKYITEWIPRGLSSSN